MNFKEFMRKVHPVKHPSGLRSTKIVFFKNGRVDWRTVPRGTRVRCRYRGELNDFEGTFHSTSGEYLNITPGHSPNDTTWLFMRSEVRLV